MKTFKDYKEAATYARKTATDCKLEMALRKKKEFGEEIYIVSFATKSDADYYRSEIIRPNEPI